jgi:hypothetical protein
MKKLLLLLALLPALASGQNVRWDLPVYTTQAQGGNLLPVYAIPGALVSFYSCAANVCPNLANTYNSATSTSACPTGSQVVLNGSAACVSSADSNGNMGSWFLPGQYMAVITSRGASYNYLFTVGGGSAAGVSSLNTLTGALSIICGTGLTCNSSGTTITITTATSFVINSFTGCGGSLELGFAVNNPTCSATYSATPSSASITNTDSVDSPLNLTSPFTSGTIVGSFSHASVHTTTITLTALGASTQTATQAYTWNPRIFGGDGASGATSTVTAAGTSAVLSTSDVITSAGLGAETTGQIIGSYTPSGQCIYLLLTGASHTFTDNNTGFPMAFNAPTSVTFVNVNGVSVPMYLYQSTNLLTGTFVPKIAS